MPLCYLCEQITPWSLKTVDFDGAHPAKSEKCNPHYRSFLALRMSGIECELCRLISNSLLDEEKNIGRSLQRDAPVFLGSKRNIFHNPATEAPQICDIFAQCGEVFVVLLAFAHLESEAALSHAVAGRLTLEPDSQAGFKMISNWLDSCFRTHPVCRMGQTGEVSANMPFSESVELPLRIIDVRASTISGIRLVESSNTKDQYVALSHRWPADPSKHFTTTRSSIHNHMRGIYLEQMPQTFQDAVKVTRQLGLRYLWIDSLCIIQNDPKDWKQQSALMGQIYYQATITIMAATALKDSTSSGNEQPPEGFLCRRPSHKLPTVQMNYYDQSWMQKGHWFIQPRLTFLFNHLELFTRGWVLQEELLSRRIVTYSPDQLIWRCKLRSILETHRDVISSYERYEDRKGWQDTFFTDHWLGSAEIYSERQLTFESDKLPALSGLASYLSKRHGQEYYAGIFSGSIPEGLLWSPLHPGCLSRPAKYIAPTWSWTSVIGPIRVKGPQRADDDDRRMLKSTLENIRFTLFPEGENPYGQLTGGKVELTGWLKGAQMCRVESTAGLLMELSADGKYMSSFCLDLAEYALAPPAIEEVECLSVLEDYALVLRKVENSQDYKRIGIVQIDPEWFQASEARKERISII